MNQPSGAEQLLLCSVDGCDRPKYARAWCRMHYRRWQRQGDPLKTLNERHGIDSSTPTYRAWGAMIQRCTNPRNREWQHYGGRGITVCESWRHSFLAFLADMGERPRRGLSIDRIDNDGNYESTNCRWATHSQQQLNKRLKTHCPQGHAYSPENTYTNPITGYRKCRICQRVTRTRYPKARR